MKKIILLGGGGHCESVIEVIRSLNQYQIVGVLDPEFNTGLQYVLDVPVVGDDDKISTYVRLGCQFIICVGQIKSPRLRERIFKRVKEKGGELPVIVAKTAYVSKTATLGEGTIVMNNALINVGCTIGSCCILNTGSLVEHGCQIGDFTHISTNAVLNGEVLCGNNSFVGSGTIVNHGVEIGDNCVVASGSLIRNNVRNQSIVAGNPMKYIT